MKPIKVGLLGIGTVGSGTFNVLRRNQEEIQRRAGRGIEIAMVADLDVARAKALVGEGVEVVGDARAVIANPEIDIVIELIGGYGMWSPPTRPCWPCMAPRFLRLLRPKA
jgi:homoserine dehydrogenase